MKSNRMKPVLAGLVAVAVIALGTNAISGQGMGYMDDEQGSRGYGHHRRGGGCEYGPMNRNLTPEQQKQMDAQRRAFFDATRKERQNLNAKQLELRAEMAKSEPDIKRASALQKEVSILQANLDQERLEHIMAMRKINPDAGRGFFMQGRGMGHGKSHGNGYGPGHCFN
jgi:Spy/CpxP family protein refolding chaperone